MLFRTQNARSARKSVRKIAEVKFIVRIRVKAEDLAFLAQPGKAISNVETAD